MSGTTYPKALRRLCGHGDTHSGTVAGAAIDQPGGPASSNPAYPATTRRRR
jgi:hypothetical protein